VVKICGLTRVEDVIMARGLGAWALGFVFAPSVRRLAPSAARALIDEAVRIASTAGPADVATGATEEGEPPEVAGSSAGEGPLTVGVFGNVSADDIAQVVEQVGLDAVQLHGDAGPRARSVREALAGWESPLRLAGRSGSTGRSTAGPRPVARGVLIIQAVPVAAEGCDHAALREKVEQARAEADLILLDTGTPARFGGTGAAFPWELARESAEGAPLLVAGGIGPGNVRVALERSSAWGVDVSSGVEASPGTKDVRLMERLFAQVAGVPNMAARTNTEEEDLREKGSRT
jgi:phosphoribosylanthranilate isomerase